jgi:uncharacterized protein (TIGR02246 family)
MRTPFGNIKARTSMRRTSRRCSAYEQEVGPQTAIGKNSQEETAMNLEELKNRLEMLEAVEAIKKLKVRYCECAEARDPEGFASLFTEDAVFEAGTFGRGQGRAGIVTFLRDVQQPMPFALHYVMNPIIEVRGDTATGRWYLLEPCTMDTAGGQPQAIWGAARYEEEYVKVKGEWKFAKVHFIPVFWSPFDQGWVEKKFVGE